MSTDASPLGALVEAVRSAVALAAADPPELLDLPATLRLTSQSKSSLYRAVSDGSFPPSVSTPSGPRWRRKDLLAWITKLKSR